MQLKVPLLCFQALGYQTYGRSGKIKKEEKKRSCTIRMVMGRDGRAADRSSKDLAVCNNSSKIGRDYVLGSCV